ncbi:unnamed protein product [Phytophthora fragariaefolia]|uniref:Unnamed protein product n=1 Tax=Phytophthora fragariaefolia TaxID=1490495 RepID=A0A9W6UF10_9STRA|nr:unnamed protein product [Phytophthora fragariaefolia]
MPKRIPWQDVAIGSAAVDVDEVLSGMKPFEVTKSNTMACTICNKDEPHKMRYRLLECTSQACEACFASGSPACSWRGKTLSCLKYELVSIYTAGYHTTAVSSPWKKKLTSTQKAFCRELADHHLKSMRIRNRMSKKFGMLLQDHQ